MLLGRRRPPLAWRIGSSDRSAFRPIAPNPYKRTEVRRSYQCGLSAYIGSRRAQALGQIRRCGEMHRHPQWEPDLHDNCDFGSVVPNGLGILPVLLCLIETVSVHPSSAGITAQSLPPPDDKIHLSTPPS